MLTESAIPPEHHDVLIVGAGLSGIGAACQLAAKCPRKSFAILEARGAIGGTWDLFRYPGIRSDSDMYTLGYSWRPWEDPKAIADGPSIRRYIVETARDHGVDAAIRLHHRVVRATWHSDRARWELEVQRGDTGQTVAMTCDFLYMCSGYYDYENGFRPPLRGLERYRGALIHPQHWPEDFDYRGKRVVVIGSGATAVTLVPAMAQDAAHVTMLQRSPSYVVSLPAHDPVADKLRRRLPARVAYAIVRAKNVLMTIGFFQLSRRRPRLVRNAIRKALAARLPAGFDIDTHFKPRYDPWDQRVCFVPDGDLFEALSSGRASMVTDGIETFTERGLKLASGAELEADAIITATGLNIKLFGGMEVMVDGRAVDFAQTVAYKGMMFSGVPNFALALGYTNASWTLKCDLVSDYVCRLLNYMDAHGYRQCMPLEPDPSVERLPLLDLRSGYVMRSLHRMPKQGARPPWRLHQNYLLDRRLLGRGELDDEGMEFSSPVEANEPAAAMAA
jgi:cation diffusion facilitator CzcD-associated flavoprotein CzcO